MGLFQGNLTSIFVGALRGLGFAKVPIVVAAVGLWGVRIPLILITTYYLKYPVTVVWAIIAADIAIRGLIIFILFTKKSKLIWQHKRTQLIHRTYYLGEIEDSECLKGVRDCNYN